MKNFIPRRAKCASNREYRQLFILGLLTIYEGLVATLSLGFFSVDCRAWYLFDVMED
jgi:hypothetical protein